MPSGSLLALLDDIATILDDVAVLTKVATKKTAGVLGDDLALNAEQVSGVRAERELPVVWAVAKGSLVNKAILVPAALAISAVIPWAITPLMVVGGTFLCFEGCEKLAHKFLHDETQKQEHHKQLIQAVANEQVDLVALERDKIKGAIRTDFILSAEIVVISLGTVAAAPLGTQLAVLVGLSLLMTVGVYGLVAGIVKLDDLGQRLALRGRRSGASFAGLQTALAKGILLAAPWLMKALSVAGTIAMFLVGGGILTHAIPGLHDFIHHQAEATRSVAGVGPILAALLPTLIDLVVGLIAGLLALLAWSGVKRLRPSKSASA
jgi:predicted DNA repair protein MutK